MSTWVGIEQLKLSDARPPGALPSVPPKLIEHVREHGPVNPVVVRRLEGGDFEILSNVETWLAVQKAGQYKVPIEIRDDIDDSQAQQLLCGSLAANPADSIEEADRFAARAQDLGGRQARGVVKQIAQEEGRSRAYVSHALRLLDLPERIQQMVRCGELTAGHARPLVTIQDRKKRLRIAERIALQRLSVRQAEDLARGRRVERKRPAQSGAQEDIMQPNQDADLRRLEAQITDTIGCETRLDHGAGRMVIHYGGDLDVLQGVLDRLGCADTW